jgi:peptidoglycan/xylan/chitin deacetylase (PgdA/CDA1 family)
MAVSRGKFLKSLGKSIPGMVLGGGITTAAQKVLGKVAAVSGEPAIPSAPADPATVKVEPVEFIKQGPAEGNRIALTFDDGPTPGVTDLILDELKQRGLRATFFMIGNGITAAPDLARRVLVEGHEVGNHTLTHPKLTALPDAQVEAEVDKTQEIIRDVLRHHAIWFRPPFGALRQNQAGMILKAGLRVVLWNVDPGDWAQPGETKIIKTVLAESRPGSIILCHDKYQQTANSVGAVLDGLMERGLEPVTLSALLAE